IYARIQDTPSSPRIVTLHKHNQYAADVKDYAFAASPNARIIGLESYKGVFVGKEIVGYTWFIGPQQAPSPIFFGDALAEIERFLSPVRALTLALHRPLAHGQRRATVPQRRRAGHHHGHRRGGRGAGPHLWRHRVRSLAPRRSRLGATPRAARQPARPAHRGS